MSVKADANWFLKGMMVNVLDPKIGIFYVSFLPQFIPPGEPLVVWTFGLVSIHVVISLIWFDIGVIREMAISATT